MWRYLTKLNKNTQKHIIPLFSFAIFILTIYYFDPKSLEIYWKGRAPYLFFMWIFLLELILWKENRNPSNSTTKHRMLMYLRYITGSVLLFLPALYIISIFQFNLNQWVTELGTPLKIPLFAHWPLSFEYIVFSVFLVTAVLLLLGLDGLKRFSASIIFITFTAIFFTIDTFFPYGRFTLLQLPVPLVGLLTAGFLNLLGYETRMFYIADGIQLHAGIGKQWASYAIYWPCMGIYSIVIYTFVMLVLLKHLSISTYAKATFFIIGAMGTFFINILRIATIYIIDFNRGVSNALYFKTFYGELYFIAFFVIYLAFVAYSGQKIWTKMVEIKGKLAIFMEKHTPFKGKMQPSI